VTFDMQTTTPYDPTRLFYEPIPYDFLYTNETKPQIMVKSDGLEAVCSSLLCDYNYLGATATVDDFTLRADNTLRIVGTGLPTDVADIKSIKFAKSDCGVVSTSDTEIICNAKKVAGKWQPEVVDSKGIIPVTTAKTEDIPLVISEVTPNTNINMEGGNLIAVKG
jgi:hypothetical protein